MADSFRPSCKNNIIQGVLLMKTIRSIASDIRTLLADDFPTVRFAAAGATRDQISREIRGIAAGNTPAAVLSFQSVEYGEGHCVRRLRFSIFVLDRFSAGGDGKAEAVWGLADTIQSIFPMGGRKVNGVFYLPESLSSAEAGEKIMPEHAALLMSVLACE